MSDTEDKSRGKAVMGAREGAPLLAAVVHERGFDLDGLLAAVCRELKGSGARLGGVLHIVADTQSRDCCSILKIIDLASGGTYEIWQDLGSAAEGCRLDERGLAAAVPAVLETIEAGVDLVVINRFGKAESSGGGMVTALAAAMEAGIPALTAVRKPYDVAWQAFHGGLAADLPPDVSPVVAWCRDAMRARSAASGQAAAPSPPHAGRAPG